MKSRSCVGEQMGVPFSFTSSVSLFQILCTKREDYARGREEYQFLEPYFLLYYPWSNRPG